MIDPDFMEHEYHVDEPLADFDMANANEIEYDDDAIEANGPEPSVVQSTQIDLDALMKSYTSYGLMNRLLFIADVCPPLKFDALKLLIEYVMKNTQNVHILMTAYQKVERAKQLGEVDGIEKIPPLDNNWVDNTLSKSQAQLEAHMAEFKRQRDEAVKESIRRSLDEVFHQHVQMGNILEALKLFGRGMREYCTAPNYVLQMLISWINVSVYANQWQKLSLLLPQAERAIAEVIDRENIQSNSSSSRAAGFPTVSTPGKNYKELVQSSKAKMAAVSGLAKMHDKYYKQAAEHFMTVDIDALDYPQLLSASDVAIYGTLCALATFSRVELKERVLGSTLFRKFLESEPKLVELLQKFCRSEFGVCLDILNELQDQALLNMFLAPHLQQLQTLIRRSSIIQYFHPYLSANIRHMAEVFRTTPDEMERELIDLIEQGLLNARVDSYGKILHAKFADNRVEIYKRVMNLHKKLNERVYGILLRAALQNHKIGVGYSEKNMRRRRGNNPNYGIDGMMDLDTQFFDGMDNGSVASTNSTGNRVIAQVQRLWNVATSRIHPSGSSTSSIGHDSAGPSLPQFSSANGVGASANNGGVFDPVPTAPNSSTYATSHFSGKSSSETVSTSENGSVPRGSKLASSDMELDDNFGDL